MKKQINFPQILVLIVALTGIFLIVISSVEQPITEEESTEKKLIEIEELGEEIEEENNGGEAIEEIPEEIIEAEPIEEEEIIEVIEPPIVKTIISNEKCENGIISLTLNNLYNDTINVKWSTFFCSGQITPNPGCDKESLAPGESTFCNNVGNFPRRGRRRVAIAIYKHTTVAVDVDCSSNLVTGSAVKEPPDYSLNPIFLISMLLLLLFVFNYYRVYY